MRTIIYILIIITIYTYQGAAQIVDFYEITRLPFTTDKFDEFAPVYHDQGLVFTSNRREGFIVARMTDNGEALLNIYQTRQRESGRWIAPELLDKSLRSNYHDGPVSFSSDGSRIYFTRNIPGKKNEELKLGIFIANYSKEGWIDITPFPYNSNNYNITHPSISQDGKTLYFASDMPGGYGGLDIYMSVFQEQSWTTPINLGELINSEKDEVFPNIHTGGRLYFSSNNSDNGFLDLFFSTKKDDNWQTPAKLPKPFNSEADDFGFIADHDLRTGFFTSSREGTDNIYSFMSTFPEFTGCNSIREPELCFVFFEEGAEAIDTTLLYFEWDMGDGTRIRDLEADHCFEDIGDYIIRLDVLDLITGEVAYNVAYYHFSIERIEQPFITSPDTTYVNQQIIFSASETYLVNSDIEGYYWEFGDGSMSEGEIVYHAYNKPGTYQVKLGILSDSNSQFGQQKSCVYKYIVVKEEYPGLYHSQ